MLESINTDGRWPLIARDTNSGLCVWSERSERGGLVTREDIRADASGELRRLVTLSLRKAAQRAAAMRGHAMGWIGEHGCCSLCGMSAMVDPTPPPNGIEVGGEAVALNCTGAA